MRAILVVLLLMPLFGAASSEMEGLHGLLEQVDKTVLGLHLKSGDFEKALKESDNLEQLRGYLGETLSALYVYDSKRILTTTIVDNGVDVGYRLLHNNFLHLSGREGEGYYLSGLIPLKGESYYFIGMRHGEGYLLLLYRLVIENGETPFVVFSSKGKALVNNGVEAERLKELSESFSDPAGQKDSFFPFKFFREYDNYYYIEE